MAEKIKLSIKQILADMKGDPINGVPGLDRAGLKAKYKLSHTDMATLFKHPELKNKKVKKEPGFELIEEDGTVSTDTASASTGTEAVQEKAPEAGVAQEAAKEEVATAADKW